MEVCVLESEAQHKQKENSSQTLSVSNRTAGVLPKQQLDNHSGNKWTETRQLFVRSTSFSRGVVFVLIVLLVLQTQSLGLWKRLLATCRLTFMWELTNRTQNKTYPRVDKSTAAEAELWL